MMRNAQTNDPTLVYTKNTLPARTSDQRKEFLPPKQIKKIAIFAIFHAPQTTQ